MYKINITYDSGDSFNHYSGLEKTIEEASWENIDAAKVALRSIQEHYRWYMICNKEWNVSEKEKKSATQKARQKDWYYEQYPDVAMYLLDDKGEKFHVSTFWCGYFESLVGADIVSDGPSDMSFRLR